MKKLIFVYNSDTGLKNSIIGGLHKVINPSTYNCSLCSLTHGVFKEKQEWKSFREQSGVEMNFLYKDSFMFKYPKNDIEYNYPTIFVAKDSGLEPLLRAKDIGALKSVKELIVLLRAKIAITFV